MCPCGPSGGCRERRRRHAAGDFIALVTAGFGVHTATSTTAMVACCLHHLNDIVPFLGLSGAATFLVAYKTPVILLGLAANGVGITLMLRTLRHATRVASAPAVAPACH